MIELRLKNFPTDGSAEWLAPKDLALAAALLRTFPEDRRTAVEIGVWKGAWSLGVLENVANSRMLGVDPYPGKTGHEIRSILEMRVAAAKLGERFRLVESLAAATSVLVGEEPVLIHIDGEHTELGAGKDLEWASQVLAPGGVIVVDDYVHIWFPGIASAMHSFLRAADFRIVLVTENKAYLCRESQHAKWYARLEASLGNQSSVLWFRHFGEGGTPRYIQVPDVLGSPVLLVLGEADVLPAEHHRVDGPEAAGPTVEHQAVNTNAIGVGMMRRVSRRILPNPVRRRLLQSARLFSWWRPQIPG